MTKKKEELEMMDWIDEQSYETLLYKWRFAPVGNQLFVGKIAQYYKDVMDEKKKKVDYVAISKKIGF